MNRGNSANNPQDQQVTKQRTKKQNEIRNRIQDQRWNKDGAARNII